MRKKKIVFMTTLMACTFLFTSCSGMGAENMAGGYYEVGVPSVGGNEYTEIVENSFIETQEEPNSYFSIDANTASYPNLRKLITNDNTIDKDAVRVEEMLNYFNYDYETPDNGEILALNASLFDNPYNAETKLLTIGLAATEVEFAEQRNNIVFLIDTSGSMSSADKLGLVQQAFMLLAENLNDDDRVSIVTYAGGDTVALEGAYGFEKKKILAVIEDLMAAGSTAGSEGIETAYDIAEKYFIEGGNNRVILATDGDFNVGITNENALKEFISEKRESGVYFSVFGVGNGNLKADKMETLALAGNGAYGYLDSIKEAKRALVQEIGGAMLTVAKDVKAGVIFNPDYVEQYRLIGYENKLLTQEEFENDSTDAGELGSGHTVTVTYEIKLTDRKFVEGENLAQVTVKYKPTENSGGLSDESKEILLDIATSVYHKEMTDTDAFVSSVIEFALILRDSQYKADATLQAVIDRLENLNLSEDEFKEEFKEIVKLYQENKMK